METFSHATFAAPLPSSFPFQRNLEQRKSISDKHAFGSIKAEDQKLIIPEITVEINCNLPAKDKERTVHPRNFDFIVWIRGAQCRTDSFFVHRGTPEYLTGSVPAVRPVAEEGIS